MPAIQGTTTIAANATNDNVLAGSQFEYLPYNARLDVGVSADVVGVLADFISGQDIVCESFGVPGTNRFPVMPDDFTLKDIAAAGDRLKLRLRNTTAAVRTLFWSVILTPTR